MRAGCTESTPPRKRARRLLWSTTASSMSGWPLDRIASAREAASFSSAGGTSAKTASRLYSSKSSRFAWSSASILSDSSAHSSDDSVTRLKSSYWRMRLRSHVYSSCFARHVDDRSAPFPGKSRSAAALTECTSKSVPYASKTSAVISRAMVVLRADATIGADVLLAISLSVAADAGAGEERGRHLAAARRLRRARDARQGRQRRGRGARRRDHAHGRRADLERHRLRRLRDPLGRPAAGRPERLGPLARGLDARAFRGTEDHAHARLGFGDGARRALGVDRALEALRQAPVRGPVRSGDPLCARK